MQQTNDNSVRKTNVARIAKKFPKVCRCKFDDDWAHGAVHVGGDVPAG